MAIDQHKYLDFRIPPDRIAAHPAGQREDSRLMVIDRSSGRIEHRIFRDLPELLRPNDRLVLNDSRVLKARLLGTRRQTGGAWEGLFLKQVGSYWEMMTKTRGHPETNEWIDVEPTGLALRLVERTGGHWLVEPSLSAPIRDVLDRFGHVPLPPYIRKGIDEPTDAERYQTVYAENDGSVAAPTAGLHFSNDLLGRLDRRGVARSFVTLHVGEGTFEPIKCDDPTMHRLHFETAQVTEQTVREIESTRAAGGRIIAVGTTSTRTLETASAGGSLQPWNGETNLFIHPPYRFRTVDCLITNFHLPRTTLLMLVAAMIGPEMIERAYHEALSSEYRFFSYGDAMLIV